MVVYHFPSMESTCAHVTFSLQQRAGSSVSFSLDRKQLCLHNIFSATKGRWQCVTSPQWCSHNIICATKGRWQCSQKVERRMVTVELCGTRWGGECKGPLQDALRPLIWHILTPRFALIKNVGIADVLKISPIANYKTVFFVSSTI